MQENVFYHRQFQQYLSYSLMHFVTCNFFWQLQICSFLVRIKGKGIAVWHFRTGVFSQLGRAMRKKCIRAFANSEDPDQHAHPRSLRIHAV